MLPARGNCETIHVFEPAASYKCVHFTAAADVLAVCVRIAMKGNIHENDGLDNVGCLAFLFLDRFDCRTRARQIQGCSAFDRWTGGISARAAGTGQHAGAIGAVFTDLVDVRYFSQRPLGGYGRTGMGAGAHSVCAGLLQGTGQARAGVRHYGAGQRRLDDRHGYRLADALARHGAGGRSSVAGSRAPQLLQKFASGVRSSYRHSGHLRAGIRMRVRSMAISELMMPVGTASMPQPSSIIKEAIARPRSVLGVMSPKPTVVTVLIAQYTAVGMLVKPLPGPSITYMRVPSKNTTMATNRMNTRILRRLATRARLSAPYSCTYEVSFRIRNMRSSRSSRISSSACISGISRAI